MLQLILLFMIKYNIQECFFKLNKSFILFNLNVYNFNIKKINIEQKIIVAPEGTFKKCATNNPGKHAMKPKTKDKTINFLKSFEINEAVTWGIVKSEITKRTPMPIPNYQRIPIKESMRIFALLDMYSIVKAFNIAKNAAPKIGLNPK